MCIRSLSMVGETASKSDGNSEPFGSGFAEEGWQDKSLYTCRKGRCLETLKVAVLPNVLETATPDIPPSFWKAASSQLFSSGENVSASNAIFFFPLDGALVSPLLHIFLRLSSPASSTFPLQSSSGNFPCASVVSFHCIFFRHLFLLLSFFNRLFACRFVGKLSIFFFSFESTQFSDNHQNTDLDWPKSFSSMTYTVFIFTKSLLCPTAKHWFPLNQIIQCPTTKHWILLNKMDFLSQFPFPIHKRNRSI